MLRGEKTIWDEAETANDRRVNMESPILGFRNVREFIGSVTLARIVLVLFVAGRATSRLSVVS
jgi:flagellar assembly factor FliW